MTRLDLLLSRFFKNRASNRSINFYHTLKGARVAANIKTTQSDRIQASAFCRQRHKMARLNQIKISVPLATNGDREDEKPAEMERRRNNRRSNRECRKRSGTSRGETKRGVTGGDGLVVMDWW